MDAPGSGGACDPVAVTTPLSRRGLAHLAMDFAEALQVGPSGARLLARHLAVLAVELGGGWVTGGGASRHGEPLLPQAGMILGWVLLAEERQWIPSSLARRWRRQLESGWGSPGSESCRNGLRGQDPGQHILAGCRAQRRTGWALGASAVGSREG